MKAPLKTRITAYLIDIIVLIVFVSLVNLVLSPNLTELNKQIDDVTLSYATGDTSFTNYITTLSQIYKQIDLQSIIPNMINILFIIGYFVILPYIYNG